MTREEEIRLAGLRICFPSESTIAFKKGAEWADKNPKNLWISVDDDLPCYHENMIALVDTLGKYTYNVLVRFNYGGISLANMNCRGYKQNWRWSERGIITHWMSIPKFKEDLL